MQLALSGMGIPEGHPQYGPAAGAMLMGYAARMADPSRTEASDTEAIRAAVPQFPDGQVDYEQLAAESGRLADLEHFTVALADDQARIQALAALTPGGWKTFVATASMQLQKALSKSHTPRRYMPTAADMEVLIRFGYAVRVVDEAVGERPFQ